MDEILKKINNSDNWPSILNDENLEMLNEMADDAFLLDTFAGKFSALLIYHQIIEAMCLHLIEDCYFFIELSVYPMTMPLKVNNNRMLGYYIDELGKSIDFDSKDEFLEKVKEFNSRRNKIVHEVTKRNISEIIELLNEVKMKFDTIYTMYDEIQDWFRLCFKDFKKDVFIDYFDGNDD